MSALILKRADAPYMPESHVGYVIVRMDEKLRALPHKNCDFGLFNGWHFYSQGCPAADNGLHIVFLRGTGRDMDNMGMSVSHTNIDSFEKAIVEFNNKHGNNKHVDMEDVIWPA